jgi:hypothetical protein
LLGRFQRHFPTDLQRIRRMKAEAVARQVDDLGVDLAVLGTRTS